MSKRKNKLPPKREIPTYVSELIEQSKSIEIDPETLPFLEIQEVKTERLINDYSPESQENNSHYWEEWLDYHKDLLILMNCHELTVQAVIFVKNRILETTCAGIEFDYKLFANLIELASIRERNAQRYQDYFFLKGKS